MRDLLALSDGDLLRGVDAIEKMDVPDRITGYESFFKARATLSRLSWDCYSAAAMRGQGAISATGIAHGPLDDNLAQDLRETLAHCEQTTLRGEDFATGYMASRPASLIAILNQCNEYRVFEPSMRMLIGKFLAEKSKDIEHLCGHGWRVGSMRQFYLKPDAPTGRHADGWPFAMKKLFILPNGATPQTGTTWFKLRTGEEVTIDSAKPLWLIFENSVVEHALVAPLRGRRDTIELDLLPSNVTNPELLDAGINGWYPWFPSERSLAIGTRLALQLAVAEAVPPAIEVAPVAPPEPVSRPPTLADRLRRLSAVFALR
jgi:hypothetical protein